MKALPGHRDELGAGFDEAVRAANGRYIFCGVEPVTSSLPGYSYFEPTAAFFDRRVMVHPGKGEDWREKELAHCTSTPTRSLLEKNNIQLVNFTELPNW